MKNILKISDSTYKVFSILVVAIILILQSNFIYEKSYDPQYLFPSMKRIFLNFAKNDWFVWNTTHYHISFTEILVFLNKTFGLHTGVFLLFCTMTILLVASIYFLIKILINDEKIFYLVFLSMIFLPIVGWAHYRLYDAGIIPHYLSMPFLIFSIAFVIKGNFLASGITLGLASLLHISYGYFGLIMYPIYFLLNRKKINMKSILFFTIPFFCIALPNFIFVLRNFLVLNKTNIPFDVNIVFFRGPHHYWPPSWPRDFTLQTILWGLLAIYGIIPIRKSDPTRSAIIFSSGILTLCGISFFSTNVILIPVIVRLFFWRFCPVMLLIFRIFGLHFILKHFLRGNLEQRIQSIFIFTLLFLAPDSRILSVLIFIFLLTMAVTSSNLNNRFILTIKMISYPLIGSGLIICFLRHKPIIPSFIHFTFISLIIFLLILLTTHKHSLKKPAFLALIILPTLLLHTLNVRRCMIPIVNYVTDNSEWELTSWIKEMTPIGSTFIIPPDIEGFRIKTHRAILVDRKSRPMKGSEMEEWAQRMSAVCGLKNLENANLHTIFKNYNNLSPIYFQKLATKYSMSHLVVRQNHKNMTSFQDNGFEEIMCTEKYVVFKILNKVD